MYKIQVNESHFLNTNHELVAELSSNCLFHTQTEVFAAQRKHEIKNSNASYTYIILKDSSQPDRKRYPNHITSNISTADFVNFKKAISKTPGHKVADSMINFQTRIVSCPNTKKVALADIIQHVDFYCDDIIAKLFTETCKCR